MATRGSHSKALFMSVQEREEGTVLGMSCSSLERRMGSSLAGSMAHSLLLALHSGGSAGMSYGPLAIVFYYCELVLFG